MKHQTKRTAVVLAAAMMLCASSAVLPDTGILRPENAITASAASYSNGQSISRNINTYYRVFNWPFANSTANHANYISGSFNERLAVRKYAPHGAIDIAAYAGTPVRPVYEGTVVACDPDGGSGWGNHIIIQHTIGNKTYYSQYSHLASMSVSKGQWVGSNTTIGTVGGSGSYGPNSYDAHLDLQISLNDPSKLSGGYQREGLTLDPLKVLQLPPTLVISAGNTNEVGEYIYDRMNVDRCPNQLKKTEVNLQHERTLTCRLSPHLMGRADGNAYFARVSDGQGWMVYGPYETYSKGNKTLKFRLKTDCNGEDYYRRFGNDGVGINHVVCRLDIYDSTAKKMIKSAEIKRSDFLFSNTYQDFSFDFRNEYSDHKLEFRIYYKATAALWADTVTLYKRNG